MVDRDRQIVLTGVEGSGRDSFASYYFPAMERSEKVIRIAAQVQKVLVVAMLDCRHLQNLAEAAMLESLAEAEKKWKTVSIRNMLVLGRVDCVCDRRQNRAWVEEVVRLYKGYLKKLHVKAATIVAHSNLAVARCAELASSQIDQDDLDDLSYLLAKSGHRLPSAVSVKNAKKYVQTHTGALQRLTGEYFVRQIIETF